MTYEGTLEIFFRKVCHNVLHNLTSALNVPLLAAVKPEKPRF